jgi:hypothetical protein
MSDERAPRRRGSWCPVTADRWGDGPWAGADEALGDGEENGDGLGPYDNREDLAVGQVSDDVPAKVKNKITHQHAVWLTAG